MVEEINEYRLGLNDKLDELKRVRGKGSRIIFNDFVSLETQSKARDLVMELETYKRNIFKNKRAKK